MDLSEILTISGKSGLYKIISKTQSSLIAESLEDGKRFPVFASNRSSTLEDITIFTKDEDIPLKEVLWKIHEYEEGKKSGIDYKADEESLKNYFEKIVPDFDKEKVYPSDIKKVIRWYNILLQHNIIIKPEKEEKEGEDKKEKGTDTDTKDQKTRQDKTAKTKAKQKEKLKPVKDTTKQTDSATLQKSKTKNIKTKKV